MRKSLWSILNITLMCLKMSVHSAETRLEGTMSQNFNVVLSFCFMVRRKENFGETNTKITVTRFLL